MLHKSADNAHEAAYINMMDDTEMQDAKEKWIEERADELMKNFSNENDWQIIELINRKLDNNCVNKNIYNQFITDICYSQATDEYKKKFKDWR